MPSPEAPSPPSILTLFEALADAFWTKAPGQPLHCSRSLLELYGVSPTELQSQPLAWLRAVHPTDREFAERSATELTERGAARALYRIVRPDGEIRWIDDQKALVETADGPIKGGICRDVTEKKSAEERSYLQQTVLGAIATGTGSRGPLELLCRELERMVPQAVATILLLDDEQRLRVAAAPGCDQELREAIDGLVPGRNVGSCGTAAFTGVPCYVDDTMADVRWEALREAAEHFGIRSCWSIPIRDPDDRVLGTIAISSFVRRASTIAHKQLLEAGANLAQVALQHDRYLSQLVNAKTEAESGTRAKSEILANVSHELRTPLTAILGFTELILDGNPPAQLLDQLETIRDSGTHLLTVINDLLDVSKVEAGRIELEPEACSFREVLREAVLPFEDAIAKKGIELEITGTESLPTNAFTDPTRLRQILLNLLSNAVKFSEHGRIEIECSAEPATESSVTVRIAVSDTGLGIAAADLERIFQPFSQADASTSRRFGGTGLGLTLSRKLARLLRGDLSVESVLGRGSTFTLTMAVPLSANTAPPSATQDGRTPAAPSPGNRLACRVLVVEDTPMLRRYVETVLRRAGAEVEVADDGDLGCRAALAAEEDRPFDVVVMDMQMPVMNGYDATRNLRSSGFRRPILALTARAQTGDAERCLEAGCDRYLSKPTRPAELIDAVARLSRAARPPQT